MRPVILIILDGWGVAPPGPGNAISQANLPFYNYLLSNYPHGLLQASGEAVGLPRGESGNSETGHLNLGAGYPVYQDLPRINLSIADGSFFRNFAFLAALNHARKYLSNIHILGLIGSGGVHSNTEHLLALLQLLKEQGFTNVYLHLITDGRDSPPKSSLIYITHIQSYLKNLGFGDIASVTGRYYAMDRDHRWDRTEKAYNALTKGKGEQAADPISAVRNSYRKGVTDEFILPTVITKNGKPVAIVKDCDSLIFFNYRVDRPRQLTNAFILDDFVHDANTLDFDPYAVKYYGKHQPTYTLMYKPFKRGKKIDHLYFVTMTEYSNNVKVSAVAFPPQIIAQPLGECISAQGLSQLRISESEKERFVTYYFNGQREAPFTGEERQIIPSSNVATYDLKPEMSAVSVTEALIKEVNRNKYNLIVVNFANPDMLAHTGIISATIKGCETIDICLSKIIPAVIKNHGFAFITADHGNAEELINLHSGGIDTEHSTFPVPFIAVSKSWEGNSKELREGSLADVATTILASMHVKKSKTMTGRNLLENIID